MIPVSDTVTDGYENIFNYLFVSIVLVRNIKMIKNLQKKIAEVYVRA